MSQNYMSPTHSANRLLFILDLHMKYTAKVVPLRMYIVWFVIVW